MRTALAPSAAMLISLLCCHGAVAATVESLEAKLFLAHTGRFSEPLPEGAELWNTIIGDGALLEPSTSTFVVVVVRDQPSTFNAKVKVRLAVTNVRTRKTTVFIEPIGGFGQSGKQHVGFWLRGTGCDELALEATVSGSETRLRKVIPFRCGE